MLRPKFVKLKRTSKHLSKRFLMYRAKRYPDIERVGVADTYWGDLYHILLKMTWPAFVGLVSILYLIINIFFALAYSVQPEAIANSRPDNFFDRFFFSVQTMASIGYGAMYPATVYANVLVTIESIVGLFFIAVTTGLVFARFSLPTARILFSKIAVVNSFNGTPTLMFRTANKRRNYILEAQLWVSLVRDEITQEGEYIRRFHDLSLVRSHSPVFTMSWLAMHNIDANSPLAGHNAETLRRDRAQIIVTLTGLDETLSQTIHARHEFNAADILWNHRFIDILSQTADGRRLIDYNHFHQAEPIQVPNHLPPQKLHEWLNH
jgi:inward rectifier potassium channel